MASLSVKIDSIRQVEGKIYIRVGKQEREFNSRQDVLDELTLIADEAREFMLRLLVTEWQRRNPSGNNPNQITNVRAVYDLDGSLNPLRFEIV